MEGWVERSLVDLEHAARHLLNALADAPAVHRFEGDGFEDQQVERALKDVGVWMHGALSLTFDRKVSPLLSNVKESQIRGHRPSSRSTSQHAALVRRKMCRRARS